MRRVHRIAGIAAMALLAAGPSTVGPSAGLAAPNPLHGDLCLARVPKLARAL